MVPVGKAIKVWKEGVRRELLLVAYVQTPDGARFTMAGWPFRSLTAIDDQGVSYRIGFRGGHAGGVLLLRPSPPHEIRWIELITAPGEPVTRVGLGPQQPGRLPPDVTVTQKAHSPGELLLDLVAARILTSAAAVPHNRRERLATAVHLELLPHPPAELGDIVAALQAAGALSPASPAPGQLAVLCAELGISGHGITAPASGELPEPWRGMLSDYHHGELRPAPRPGSLAAAVAELPEFDGVRVAILGVHHGERGTILHILANGVTTGDDWAYASGVRPPPVIWIRDSGGHWHATRTDGVAMLGKCGDVLWWLEVVPPLPRDITWIDVIANGLSAQVHASIQLRWQ
ncbi:MAG: hypothetical protein ACRDPO_37905 [Streptosporangiaceae bacterium]